MKGETGSNSGTNTAQPTEAPHAENGSEVANKKLCSLLERLDQLDKRRETVEVHFRHTLLRLQADALASTLREPHISRVSSAVNAPAKQPKYSDVSNKRQRAQEATKQVRFFGKATRQLMRTSNEFRGWTFDVRSKTARLPISSNQ